jgi:GntR family transcriptional regulator
VLRRQVLHGEFEDGLLPSEVSLAKEFTASRNAVREALAILSAEGLITRVQGTGTVVAGHKVQHGLERLRGLAETLREHGEVAPRRSPRRPPSPNGCGRLAAGHRRRSSISSGCAV